MSAQWIMKKKRKKDLDPVGVLQQGLLLRATPLLFFFLFCFVFSGHTRMSWLCRAPMSPELIAARVAS